MGKVLFFLPSSKILKLKKGHVLWKTKCIAAVRNKINCKQFFCLSSRAIHLVLVDFVSEYTDDVL